MGPPGEQGKAVSGARSRAGKRGFAWARSWDAQPGALGWGGGMGRQGMAGTAARTLL